uniref:Uncharacterized protein n=1 Tax=Pararge aegeria TaxID=116150 RepID=S4NFX4_9NEOP
MCIFVTIKIMKRLLIICKMFQYWHNILYRKTYSHCVIKTIFWVLCISDLRQCPTLYTPFALILEYPREMWIYNE